MLDRQKLEVLLGRRFIGATVDQIAAAANAIMALEADDTETSMASSEAVRRQVYRNDSAAARGGLDPKLT